MHGLTLTKYIATKDIINTGWTSTIHQNCLNCLINIIYIDRMVEVGVEQFIISRWIKLTTESKFIKIEQIVKFSNLPDKWQKFYIKKGYKNS